MRTSTRLLFAAAALMVSQQLIAAPTTVRVLAIVDGDTLTVRMPDGRPMQVRLADIDAPEKCQESGQRSTTILTGLAMGKDVQLDVTGKDAYGRMLGHISTADLGSINAAMVERGAAWVFRKYSNDPKLIGLESTARTFRVGLWSDSAPVSPWDWRQSDHACERPKAASQRQPVVTKAYRTNAPERPAPDGAAVLSGMIDRYDGLSVDAASRRLEFGGPSNYGVARSNGGTTAGSTQTGPVHTGPRGGRYTITDSGNKSYVKR